MFIFGNIINIGCYAGGDWCLNLVTLPTLVVKLEEISVYIW